jgi:hypothetical protein
MPRRIEPVNGVNEGISEQVSNETARLDWRVRLEREGHPGGDTPLILREDHDSAIQQIRPVSLG